jgi:hypothetical protein
MGGRLNLQDNVRKAILHARKGPNRLGLKEIIPVSAGRKLRVKSGGILAWRRWGAEEWK